MIKKICALIILILTLSSCLDTQNESSRFLYKKAENSVEFKIINGNDYLFYDTPTRADFEWINIDPKKSSIYGAGIKILEANNNVTKTEITLPSNYLKNDTLNIKLNFEIAGDKLNTEFKIPVKDKELNQ